MLASEVRINFRAMLKQEREEKKKIYITFCLHICIEGFIKNSFRVMMIKWRTSCWKGNVCYYYGCCCCFFFIIFISKGPCFGLYLDITCVSFGRGSTSQFLCQIKETCLILDNVVIYAQNRYIVDIFFIWCHDVYALVMMAWDVPRQNKATENDHNFKYTWFVHLPNCWLHALVTA